MKNPKAKILMIDDEEGFTRLARLTLIDYEICEENDSARALETAPAFQPDLILLDVMMPGLDGGDIAAQIRADAKLKSVPIVFLTAMVTGMETAARPDFGGFPFIAKPVTPERLAENIEKHLRP
jgi:CheY-like chemotaxis protein